MCAACHRLDGRDKGIPSIVGIDKRKFAEAMAAFKSGARSSSIMHAVALSLSDSTPMVAVFVFNGMIRKDFVEYLSQLLERIVRSHFSMSSTSMGFPVLITFPVRAPAAATGSPRSGAHPSNATTSTSVPLSRTSAMEPIRACVEAMAFLSTSRSSSDDHVDCLEFAR
jgi:hypothetical protein